MRCKSFCSYSEMNSFGNTWVLLLFFLKFSSYFFCFWQAKRSETKLNPLSVSGFTMRSHLDEVIYHFKVFYTFHLLFQKKNEKYFRVHSALGKLKPNYLSFWMWTEVFICWTDSRFGFDFQNGFALLMLVFHKWQIVS